MGADEDAVADALLSCDLVVQCTSVGLHGSATDGQIPIDLAKLSNEAFVADLIANPVETPLVKTARASGRGALGGLPMLVYQGAAAFELWTEREAPVEVMLAEAEAAMTGSAT